jgi:hypothetical protein
MGECEALAPLAGTEVFNLRLGTPEEAAEEEGEGAVSGESELARFRRELAMRPLIEAVMPVPLAVTGASPPMLDRCADLRGVIRGVEEAFGVVSSSASLRADGGVGSDSVGRAYGGVCGASEEPFMM